MKACRQPKVLRVQRPCRVEWASLATGDQTRWCQHCLRVVHDLEALSADEIRKLVQTNPAGFCGSYIQRDNQPFIVPQQQAALRASSTRHLTAAALVALSACPQPEAGRKSTQAYAAAPGDPVLSPTPAAYQQHETKPPELTAEQRDALRVLGYVAP